MQKVNRSINHIDQFKHHYPFIKPKLRTVPQYMILSDLDETLFDHADPKHYWYHALEDYLTDLRSHYNIYFGIITGCNFHEAKNKLNDLNMHHYPDFLSVGFGTEIYYTDHDNQLIEDEDWRSGLETNFNKAIISKLVMELKKYRINLVSEKRSENDLKDSYYYFISKSCKIHLRIIRLLASQYHVKAIISKCNQNIGDPEDAYDVDFVPFNSGKDKVVKYIINQTCVDKNNVFAFGDSENDLALLKSIPKGYAVSNATDELKHYIQNICRYNHSHGILDTLQNFFEKRRR